VIISIRKQADAGGALKLRLVRRREHGFLSGEVVRVFRAFGTDIFHPFT
jgi:hypothetical protein